MNPGRGCRNITIWKVPDVFYYIRKQWWEFDVCVCVCFVELYNDITIMMNWKWISSYSVLMLRCGKLFNTINILASDMAWLRSPCPRLQRAELSQLWSYFIQTEFQFVVGWFYRANWRHCTRSTIVNQKEYNKSAKSERLIINNSNLNKVVATLIDFETWNRTPHQA